MQNKYTWKIVQDVVFDGFLEISFIVYVILVDELIFQFLTLDLIWGLKKY